MNDYQDLVLTIVKEIKEDVKEIRNSQSDQDKRLDRLEQKAKWRSSMFGMLAGGAISLVVAGFRSRFGGQ